jgi:hypothetical protein
MRGLDMLKGLLKDAPGEDHKGLRVPSISESMEIVEALKRIASPALLDVATGELADELSASVAEGKGIVQVGIAPGEIEIEGGVFRCRIDVRLVGDPWMRHVQVEGSLEPTVKVTSAVQIDRKSAVTGRIAMGRRA